MTPLQLIAAGHKLYGRKKWKPRLAEALGVNVSTIHRITHREIVPGPYEVAIQGLLEHNRRQRELEVAARKLLPLNDPRRKRKRARRSDYGKPRKAVVQVEPQAREEPA